MSRLQGLIAKALKNESRTPSLRSEGEQSFLWQVKHATDVAVPLPAYRFHLERKWEFDFAWPDVLIAVEIEGGIWRGRGFGSKTSANPGGAHSHPTQILRDIEKYNEAARMGWRVFRFTTDMVDSGEAIAFLGTIGLPKKRNSGP